MGDRLVLAAPAKVNLYLAVGERRSDGYHEVETVLQTLELHDTVSLTPSADLHVTCEPDVGVPEESNLVTRAARALAGRVGREASFRIEVTKRIPAGGGLGGGSSDAAAALVGLASAWDLDPADPVLSDVGATLGADVPFFLVGGCALMGGRGDELAWRLPTLPLHVAIVNPGVPVPTARAYAAFDEAPPPAALDTGAILQALESRDPTAVGLALCNNLTGSAARLAPAVSEVLAFVSGCEGLLGFAMAGSGSSVFGVFSDAPHASAAALAAGERGWWATATTTRPTGVAVEGERA